MTTTTTNPTEHTNLSQQKLYVFVCNFSSNEGKRIWFCSSCLIKRCVHVVHFPHSTQAKRQRCFCVNGIIYLSQRRRVGSVIDGSTRVLAFYTWDPRFCCLCALLKQKTFISFLCGVAEIFSEKSVRTSSMRWFVCAAASICGLVARAWHDGSGTPHHRQNIRNTCRPTSSSWPVVRAAVRTCSVSHLIGSN